MTAVIIGLFVLVLGTIWLVVAEKIRLPVAGPDIDENLPTNISHIGDDVSSDDIRFATALRGYRMDQVDAVINQLVTRIQKQEELLGQLKIQQRQDSCD